MKVAAVIPAYNEASTIAQVVRTAKLCRSLDEVIVVSDGSVDGTVQEAARAGARIIVLPHNQGKGAAVMAGVKATDADIIVLLDADLVGLRAKHIVQLLIPVKRGLADMTVGMFNSGRTMTNLSQRITPFLNGQRAIVRTLFDGLTEMEFTRYGVDITISRIAKQNGLRVHKVKLYGLTQVMKEEKLGFWRGFGARLKMYWEILIALRQKISNQ
jgi:glycosyltransferase involved in cell wall biosynthesis